MSLKRDYEKLASEYSDAKKNLALKYAKYSVGQKLKVNNFPDSKSTTAVVDDIGIDVLGNQIHIVYWCNLKNDRCRMVYESEVLKVLK